VEPALPLAAVDDKDRKAIQERIKELQVEHRDLDDVVSRLSEDVNVDQLRLRRLKKRKLLLKDQIERLKSLLIPDLNA
jgi:hypothetical protein